MAAAAATKPRRRFVIDCDPGVDDAVALLMAVSHCSRNPGDQLLAVSTTHGNVGLDQTTLNAAKVLDVLPAGNAHFDARRVPIHKGCPGPLIRSDKQYFPWHGVDGLGDAGLPDAVGRHVHEEEHAALALIRLCSEYPGEVSGCGPWCGSWIRMELTWEWLHWIVSNVGGLNATALTPSNPRQITLVCLGPLTTVALACRLDPSLPGKVKEMLWMGGTLQAKGNVSLTGEFNIHKVRRCGGGGSTNRSIDRSTKGTDRPAGVSHTYTYTPPQDPEAAHIVLSAFPESTMIAWEMTERHTVEVSSGHRMPSAIAVDCVYGLA